MTHEREQMPWSALAFVAVAGGVALAFVAIGYFFARKKDDQQLGDAPTIRLVPTSTAALSPAPVAKRRYTSPLVGTDNFGISTSPKRILSRSAFDGKRFVTIGTDQPIRVALSQSVNANSGIYVDSHSAPKTLGPFDKDVELWAVRASVNDASIGVMTEISPAG